MPKIRDFDPLKKRPLKTFEDRDVAPLKTAMSRPCTQRYLGKQLQRTRTRGATAKHLKEMTFPLF